MQDKVLFILEWAMSLSAFLTERVGMGISVIHRIDSNKEGTLKNIAVNTLTPPLPNVEPFSATDKLHVHMC